MQYVHFIFPLNNCLQYWRQMGLATILGQNRIPIQDIISLPRHVNLQQPQTSYFSDFTTHFICSKYIINQEPHILMQYVHFIYPPNTSLHYCRQMGLATIIGQNRIPIQYHISVPRHINLQQPQKSYFSNFTTHFICSKYIINQEPHILMQYVHFIYPPNTSLHYCRQMGLATIIGQNRIPIQYHISVPRHVNLQQLQKSYFSDFTKLTSKDIILVELYIFTQCIPFIGPPV